MTNEEEKKSKTMRARRTTGKGTDSPTASAARKSRAATVSPASRQARLERYLDMPWGDWRQKKRQQWADVMRAIDAFEFGSAYTPAGSDLFEVQRAARRVADAMSEDWVSW